jgi:hypothetical protein
MLRLGFGGTGPRGSALRSFAFGAARRSLLRSTPERTQLSMRSATTHKQLHSGRVRTWQHGRLLFCSSIGMRCFRLYFGTVAMREDSRQIQGRDALDGSVAPNSPKDGGGWRGSRSPSTDGTEGRFDARRRSARCTIRAADCRVPAVVICAAGDENSRPVLVRVKAPLSGPFGLRP